MRVRWRSAGAGGRWQGERGRGAGRQLIASENNPSVRACTVRQGSEGALVEKVGLSDRQLIASDNNPPARVQCEQGLAGGCVLAGWLSESVIPAVQAIFSRFSRAARAGKF